MPMFLDCRTDCKTSGPKLGHLKNGVMRQEEIFLVYKMIIRIKILTTRIIHLPVNIRLFRRMHRAGTAAPAESPIQKPGGSNKQNAHLPFTSLYCSVSKDKIMYHCLSSSGGSIKQMHTCFFIFRGWSLYWFGDCDNEEQNKSCKISREGSLYWSLRGWGGKHSDLTT